MDNLTLPAELRALAGKPCTYALADEVVALFDWHAAAPDARDEFIATIFGDCEIGKDFSGLLTGDPPAWDAGTLLPFGLGGVESAAPFAKAGEFPQFNRLLLLDAAGAVFAIEVDGTAVPAKKPKKLKSSVAQLKIAAAKASPAAGGAPEPWAELCDQAFALLAAREYKKVAKLLKPALQSPPRDDASMGGCFTAYGISLSRASKPFDAIKAFQSGFACGGPYAGLAFYALAVACLSVGQAATVVQLESESGAAERVDVKAAREALEPHFGYSGGVDQMLVAYIHKNPDSAAAGNRVLRLFQ